MHTDLTHRIEVAPRPSPLIEVSMANADEFLCDGDFGLSVGEGHFPARVIQQITGSPYVHVVGVRKVLDLWYLIESVPPCVRLRRLDECVSEYSGLYDFFRLAPGLCNLDAAWDWALRAEGTPYSYLDLWLVWRRRYRKAVAEGRCEEFDFPSAGDFCGNSGGIQNPDWRNTARVPDPIPNSDDPCHPRRDCSHLWADALRIAGLTPMLPPYTCDWVPGDFSVAPLFTYCYTLVDPKTTPRAASPVPPV